MASVKAEGALLEANTKKILDTIERICRSRIDNGCKLQAIHILSWPGSEAVGVWEDVMKILDNPSEGAEGKLLELLEGLRKLCKK